MLKSQEICKNLTPSISIRVVLAYHGSHAYTIIHERKNPAKGTSIEPGAKGAGAGTPAARRAEARAGAAVCRSPTQAPGSQQAHYLCYTRNHRRFRNCYQLARLLAVVQRGLGGWFAGRYSGSRLQIARLWRRRYRPGRRFTDSARAPGAPQLLVQVVPAVPLGST